MPSNTLKEVILTQIRPKLLIIAVSFLATVIGLCAPFFQKAFFDGLSQSQNLSHGVSIAGLKLSFVQIIFLTFILLFLSSLLFQLASYLGQIESIRVQQRLSSKMYSRILNLKSYSWAQHTIGDFISLYTTDIPGATLLLEQTLPQGANVIFPITLAPIALLFFFEIPIWQTVLLLLATIGVNIFLAHRQSGFFHLFKELAAKRVAVVNEWIQNIYFLRVLSFTSLFESRIFKVRNEETQNRHNMTRNAQVMNSLSGSMTFFINLAGLVSLIYFSNHPATPGDLLAMTWILGVFLIKPFRQLPWLFTFAFDAWTSLKRLDHFQETVLMDPSPHIHGRATTRNDVRAASTIALGATLGATLDASAPSAISLRGLSVEVAGRKLLENLDLDVSPGEFVAIVGELGSGKSTLLYSLIGETLPEFKKYEVFGKPFSLLTPDEITQVFAFVPQQGFVLSASLRENIQLEYEPRAAPTNLEPPSNLEESLDLAQFHLSKERFQNGLDTRVGERGLDLSGGQKQRLSLARAHLCGSQILLLDDCLSAVDVETEKALTDKLLFGAWKNRTRILVTHRLQILPQVDRIFFLSHGRLLKSGTYQELMQICPEFSKFILLEEQKKEQEA